MQSALHHDNFRRLTAKQQAAYDEQQKITQSKMKECLEKQKLKSFDKLSNALGTNTSGEGKPDHTSMRMDEDPATTLPGENKVIVNKRSKRKQKHSYKMKSTLPKQKEDPSPAKVKRKPRFFCQF